MKRWAIVRDSFVGEVQAQLAKERAEGEWTGPNPDPDYGAIVRVLYALGRMGYTVSKLDSVVEPQVTYDRVPHVPPSNPFMMPSTFIEIDSEKRDVGSEIRPIQGGDCK